MTRSPSAARHELANPATAFPTHLRLIWDQHFQVPDEPPLSPHFSSLGTLLLRKTNGNKVTEHIIERGRYEASIGSAAADSDLLTLASRYQIRQADLIDFRATPDAVPQEIPCRTSRYRRTRLVEGEYAVFEFDDLSEPSTQTFIRLMEKYKGVGLSPAVTLTWARWRAHVAVTRYASRKIHNGSISKPSDQRREFEAFHNALHRVAKDLQAGVLAPAVKSALLEEERAYNAHMAVAQCVLEHLLRLSERTKRELKKSSSSAGAPKQVERAELLAEISVRLGEGRKKIPLAQRKNDAAEIAMILGVQRAFIAVDEGLSGD